MKCDPSLAFTYTHFISYKPAAPSLPSLHNLF